MSERKFITKERLISLQESVGFLDNYKTMSLEVVVGNSIIDINLSDTILLHELGIINQRRNQIIELLCQKEK